MNTKSVWVLFGFLLATLFLVSCRGKDQGGNPIVITQVVQIEMPGEVVEKVVTAVPPSETQNHTSVPVPDTLVVCMAGEPVDLLANFLIIRRNIREAIYDGPFDLLNFEYIPVIMEKTPQLDDGDVIIQPVEVQAGDVVLNTDGELAELAEGVRVRPAGCYERACEEAFTGDALRMDQMVVTFRLLEGLKWSDGEPLTSDDSLYAFEVFSDPDSWRQSADRRMVERTQSYETPDERTVVWTGIPGYLDSTYPTLFFPPMPRHAWGNFTPAEIQTMPEITRAPLGWGPYVVDEWELGNFLRLKKNENYFRAAEGLPKFETLVFRFVDNTDAGLAGVLAGECDVLLGAPQAQLDLILELAEKGTLQAQIVPSTSMDTFVFAVEPVESYSGFSSTGAFKNPKLIQAIAACMDREGIVATTTAGQSQVLDSYLPPFHPYYNPNLPQYPFDPASAMQKLDAIGWVDTDQIPETPRVAQGVPGVPDGTSLIFNLTIPQTAARKQVAQLVQQNLRQCGIEVYLEFLDDITLNTPGPDGPLGGRRFDMTLITSLLGAEPPCAILLSEEIPGDDPILNPQGWFGANWTGYRSERFDRACLNALGALPGSPEKSAFHQEVQQIIMEDLPVLPLQLLLKISISRPEACGVIQDPTAFTWTWNIEEFGYGVLCGQ